MPQYVLLMTWTETALKKTIPKKGDTSGTALVSLRAELTEVLEAQNAGLVSFHWTLGPHDMHAIIEADSDAVAGGVALYLGQTQGVRTTTLRAFEVEEMASGRGPREGALDPAAAELTVADVNYRCHF
jgi:uncharacterized protein with GYD domain